ncbi:conserved hypothetical protein [Ricinus communis]|uniref:Uncharacterized protein n=1 Tax=Ricinus communis TaxID=3988 RepID=B9SUF8_RICCO|nr:conserved hypothetical protein [Ricinus communis]
MGQMIRRSLHSNNNKTVYCGWRDYHTLIPARRSQMASIIVNGPRKWRVQKSVSKLLGRCTNERSDALEDTGN